MVSNSKEYSQNYYKNNKLRLQALSSAKETCELCEVTYSHSHKSKHESSRLHIKLLKIQSKQKSDVQDVLSDIDTMIAKDIEPRDFK